MTIKELREQTGMNKVQFATYFNIPYRTLQGWESGTETSSRSCPDYLLELMQYKLEKENKLKPL